MSGLLRRIKRSRTAGAGEPPADQQAAAPEGAGTTADTPPAGDEAKTSELPVTSPPAIAADPDRPAGLDEHAAAAQPPSGRRGRLRRRLRYLRRARELMLRDLGGLVYEVHRTGGGDFGAHRGVIDGKLERLAILDAESGAIEQALGSPRGETVVFEPGVGGTCDECGELYASSARFCSRCGTPTDPAAREAPAPTAEPRQVPAMPKAPGTAEPAALGSAAAASAAPDEDATKGEGAQDETPTGTAPDELAAAAPDEPAAVGPAAAASEAPSEDAAKAGAKTDETAPLTPADDAAKIDETAPLTPADEAGATAASKPARAASKPARAADEPAATAADEPATTTADEPATTTADEPATAADEPATTTADDPETTAADEPATATDEPATAAADESATAADEPATTAADEPATATDEPATTLADEQGDEPKGPGRNPFANIYNGRPEEKGKPPELSSGDPLAARETRE